MQAKDSPPSPANGPPLAPSVWPQPHGPLLSVPARSEHPEAGRFVPNDQECRKLWDDFAMPPHIREHSEQVALIATVLGELALEAGLPVDLPEVRASALLHDLAKDYTIKHGGNHALLGGAWVVEVTGNPAIAQGVAHHVFWPWEEDVRNHFLPLAIIYADKRVKHRNIVTLDERHQDLIERYGKTKYIRERIEMSKQQVITIEQELSRELNVDLHASTFDSRGLVQRT